MRSIESQHKKNIQRCFSRASERYNHASQFQQDVGKSLVRRVEKYLSHANVLLDVGSGTGVVTEQLLNCIGYNRAVLVDFSHPMVTYAKQRLCDVRISHINADFDHLPLHDRQVDFIFSNMTLQWSVDFRSTMVELLRVLQPGGIIASSIFLASDIKEDLATNRFMELPAIKHLFSSLSIKMLDFNIEAIPVNFNSMRELLNFFKNTGANYAMHDTGKRYLPKSFISRLDDPIEPVTFYVLFFLLRKI